MKEKLSGFTLIEMLIVIVIIGILAAALVPRLQSIQGRARDTKRIADITQINNGILIYFNDNGTYPLASNGAIGICSLNSNCYVYSDQRSMWFSGMIDILTSLPQDPRNQRITGTGNFDGARLTGNYVYQYGNVMKNGKSYTLFSALETANHPDSCAVQAYRFYINASYTCNVNAGGWCPNCPAMYIKADVGP